MKPGQMRKTVVILALSLIAALIAGTLVYRDNRNTVIAETFSRLTLFHGLRKAALEDYLNSKASDVRAMSRNPRVVRAVQEFSAAWAKLQSNRSEDLRRLYILDNPFALGERHQLDRAPDNSLYSEVHKSFHEWAKRFLRHFGYYDLFLIDRLGNILYTVEKKDDFATNLRDGPYESGPLGEVFQGVQKGNVKRVVFSDFEHYSPSNNAPAAFAGSAILTKTGEVVGTFAVQLPSEPIDDILRLTAGMGRTGETYLVGNDALMRSQSRFSEKPTLLETKVDTPSVKEGLGGFSGTKIISNYRAIPVLSVYSPVDFKGAPWVLLAEMAKAEVLAKLRIWPALFAAFIAGIIAAAIALIASNIFFGNSRRSSSPNGGEGQGSAETR